MPPMAKEPCTAASGCARMMLATQVGKAPECLTLEDTATKVLTFVKNVVEEKEWKNPEVKDWRKDLVIGVMTLANRHLFR